MHSLSASGNRPVPGEYVSSIVPATFHEQPVCFTRHLLVYLLAENGALPGLSHVHRGMLRNLFADSAEARSQLYRCSESMLTRMMHGPLTEMGSAIKDAVRESEMLNCGCGAEHVSFEPLLIADAFGAKQYTAVDRCDYPLSGPLTAASGKEQLQRLFDAQNTYRIRQDAIVLANVEHPSLSATWYQDDMLGFVAKIPEEHTARRVIVLSGLEWKEESARAEKISYTGAFVRELLRITDEGDIIIYVSQVPAMLRALLAGGFRGAMETGQEYKAIEQATTTDSVQMILLRRS